MANETKKFADKETLAALKQDLLNRSVNAQKFIGRGKKTLERSKSGNTMSNVLTQSMLSAANTEYVIQYDFVLGEDITMPGGCVLKFDGGSISGSHTITGTNTGIVADLVKIFGSDITLSGKWDADGAYVEWFGAKGDNATDDTDSLRVALWNANNARIPLVFQNQKQYIITGALNYYNGSYFNFDAILRGQEYREFSDEKHGILLVVDENEDRAVFMNASRVSGTMKALRFVCVKYDANAADHYPVTNSHSTDKSSIFYNCTTQRFTFEKCFVFNVNVFGAGTKFTKVTRIRQNRIKAFYFHKPLRVPSSSTSVTSYDEVVGNEKVCFARLWDSFIENNYISGSNGSASEWGNVDNICFSGASYNGSYIRNNFIDFYKTIFDPGINTKAGDANYGGSDGWGNINSIGNQYQVFRYFYRNMVRANHNQSYISLNSKGDAFNWMNPSKHAMLAEMDNRALNIPEDRYEGQDGENHKIPPYILCVEDGVNINITDCVLENNTGNVVFIKESILSARTKIQFTCNAALNMLLEDERDSIIPVARLEGSTDGLVYDINPVPPCIEVNLDDRCIPTVEELPATLWTTRSVNGTSVTGTFSKYLLGEKVRYNGHVYTFRRLYRRDFGTVTENEVEKPKMMFKYEWVQDDMLRTNMTLDDTAEYSDVGSDGILNIKYSTCRVRSTGSYNTISTLNIPESLYFTPITIYNYGGANDVIISAVKWNGADVVLKPYQCCVVELIKATNYESLKCLSVSTPNDAARIGTFAQAQQLVQQGKVGASDIGYAFFATDKGNDGKGEMIYYTGDANTPWVYSDGQDANNVEWQEEEFSIFNPNCAEKTGSSSLTAKNGLLNLSYNYDGTNGLSHSLSYDTTKNVANYVGVIVDFNTKKEHVLKFKTWGNEEDSSSAHFYAWVICAGVWDAGSDASYNFRTEIQNASGVLPNTGMGIVAWPSNCLRANTITAVKNGDEAVLHLPANIKSVGIIGMNTERIAVKFKDGSVREQTHPNRLVTETGMSVARPAAKDCWVGREFFDATIGGNIHAVKVDTTADAVVWKDGNGYTPVAHRSGTTAQRPLAAIIGFEGELPTTWDNLHEGFTFKSAEDGKWYTLQGKNGSSLAWEEEASSHAGVPSDAPRKGSTAQRPTAEYAYNNLYAGYNYYDTDLELPLYIKSVERSGEEGSYAYTIEWGVRSYYGNDVLLPSDAGFRYFDTTEEKPVWWTGTAWLEFATESDVEAMFT